MCDDNVAYLGGFSNVCHYVFMLFSKEKKRIYLDYASATFVRPEVKKVMEPYFGEIYGNASAIHAEGVQARNAIEAARESLARMLHIRTAGIVFTASGTESNNLAIFGTIAHHYAQGVAYADMEIVSTAVEHASIAEALSLVATWGVTVIYVTLDESGIIDAQSLKESLSEKTILVTFAYVNSEIGTIQPVGKLSRIVRAHEKEFSTKIIVHVDAAQAPLWLPCTLDTLLVDALSLDAGKCYGPKGIGVLAFKHGVSFSPHLYGGGQEGGLRPGTENTPLIIGAVKALVMAQADCVSRSESVMKLRDSFIKELELIEGVVLNGHRTERVANNVNISIPGIDSEFAVISLDEKGIACATKSACGGARGDGSAVVLSVSGDTARALSTLRFSLGEDTTSKELFVTAKILRAHIDTTRLVMQKLTSI